MAVQGVNNAYYTTKASAEQSRQVGGELGKDAFLQILVAQMANQDPLSPTSDTEFIAQMAQFSSLEQIQNLNETMTTQAVYNYMGKDVTAETAMDTEGNILAQSVYGTVIGVSHANGNNYLQVSDYATGEIFLVTPDQVLQVIDNQSVNNQMLSLLQQMVTNTERSAEADESTASAMAEAIANAAAKDAEQEAEAVQPKDEVDESAPAEDETSAETEAAPSGQAPVDAAEEAAAQ